MGREIRRVPIDFDAPLDKVWRGFLNPHPDVPQCAACGGYGRDQSYRNVETLVRLVLLAGSDSVRTTGSPPHPYFASTPLDRVGPKMHELTAGLAGREPSVFGHDALDAWSATRKLIKAAGLDPETWGMCERCGGNEDEPGHEDARALRDSWEPTGPPNGEAYQLWSTTTEGTPMSPPMETPEALARWLDENRVSSFGSDTQNYEQWLAFINGPGWAPSMVANSKGLRSGVEAVADAERGTS